MRHQTARAEGGTMEDADTAVIILPRVPDNDSLRGAEGEDKGGERRRADPPERPSVCESRR